MNECEEDRPVLRGGTEATKLRGRKDVDDVVVNPEREKVEWHDAWFCSL
jgi:hypothetical protein